LRDVIIIGGGLAGLVNAIQLARTGLDVLLLEKNQYPFHKVCGEYISNEVVPFMKSLGIYPLEMEPAQITRFQLTSTNENQALLNLDLGGFGISRYALDHYLLQKAVEAGATVLQNASVEYVNYEDDEFQVAWSGSGEGFSRLVIGAYGKRSKLDKGLDRGFISKRSPFIAVKYHIKTNFPPDLIALHNFRGGYCGIVKVEGENFNLCYLSRRENLKISGSISQMEEQILSQNPYLRTLFKESEFIFEKPLVINEVSFTPKNAVEDHILMSGDSAGLITPLCGNGMAMAIHSAKILSQLILHHYDPKGFSRYQLESEYAREWSSNFARRLWVGRATQNLFGSPWASNLGVGLFKYLKPLARKLVEQTHGDPF